MFQYILRTSFPPSNRSVRPWVACTWCIDTGAQVSVIPTYKASYVKLSESDREFVGAGDVPLMTLGCVPMSLTLDDKVIEKRVYVVRGASKLLLGKPAIRSLGLIQEILGTYSLKAVHHTSFPDNSSLRSEIKEDISSSRQTGG